MTTPISQTQFQNIISEVVEALPQDDSVCDCCMKSWGDIDSEIGICNCLCSDCGDHLSNCRYTCT